MSALLARIMLAVFMLPLAAILYVVAFIVGDEVGSSSRAVLAAGVATWSFIAVYWWLLWRELVAWTAARTMSWLWTAGGAVAAALAAGIICSPVADEFGLLIGTMTAPLVWLVLTVFAWRETPTERATRVRGAGGANVVCPTCGYNLTGLYESRCPECGGRFTLDELFAAQPDRAHDQIER